MSAVEKFIHRSQPAGRTARSATAAARHAFLAVGLLLAGIEARADGANTPPCKPTLDWQTNRPGGGRLVYQNNPWREQAACISGVSQGFRPSQMRPHGLHVGKFRIQWETEPDADTNRNWTLAFPNVELYTGRRGEEPLLGNIRALPSRFAIEKIEISGSPKYAVTYDIIARSNPSDPRSPQLEVMLWLNRNGKQGGSYVDTIVYNNRHAFDVLRAEFAANQLTYTYQAHDQVEELDLDIKFFLDDAVRRIRQNRWNDPWVRKYAEQVDRIDKWLVTEIQFGAEVFGVKGRKSQGEILGRIGMNVCTKVPDDCL